MIVLSKTAALQKARKEVKLHRKDDRWIVTVYFLSGVWKTYSKHLSLAEARADRRVAMVERALEYRGFEAYRAATGTERARYVFTNLPDLYAAAFRLANEVW